MLFLIDTTYFFNIYMKYIVKAFVMGRGRWGCRLDQRNCFGVHLIYCSQETYCLLTSMFKISYLE